MRCRAGRKSGSCLSTQDMKKRTIVYIDGFNLYYGLLRFSRSKWLDVVAFANSLLPRPDEHEILSVKYFTARVNYDPAEPTAQMRQSIYLSALAAFRPELSIIEGYYKRFRARSGKRHSCRFTRSTRTHPPLAM